MKFAKFALIAAIATTSFAATAGQETGERLAMCSGVYGAAAKIFAANGGAKGDIDSNKKLATAFAQASNEHIGVESLNISLNVERNMLAKISANDSGVANMMTNMMKSVCPAFGKANGVGKFL